MCEAPSFASILHRPIHLEGLGVEKEQPTLAPCENIKRFIDEGETLGKKLFWQQGVSLEHHVGPPINANRRFAIQA